jgi:hypothetical protein
MPGLSANDNGTAGTSTAAQSTAAAAAAADAAGRAAFALTYTSVDKKQKGKNKRNVTYKIVRLQRIDIARLSMLNSQIECSNATAYTIQVDVDSFSIRNFT